MGCGPSSQVASGDVPNNNNNVNKTSHTTAPVANKKVSSTPKVKPENTPQHDNKEAKKAVAFEIAFENGIDSLISKHPPKRLQHLAPLPSNAPKLTADQLEEKIRLAEENRLKELEKKKTVSRRSTHLRQEVMRARELEREQEQREIDEKLRLAENQRLKKQEEIELKKKQREERAKKAREKARKMKAAAGEDLDYDLEKDEGFNKEDVDSWLDGDNNTSDYHTDTDRFTSGDHIHRTANTDPLNRPNYSQRDTEQHYNTSELVDDFFDT